MLQVSSATPDDFGRLVELESALFHEDAGQHDPYADTSWPSAHGLTDLEQLSASPDGLVLVARSDTQIVGLLVGYTTPSSPTRQPVKYAILRTMYVDPDARRLGAANAMIQAFLSWAREQGCVEAHVDHYTANTAAAHLYEQAGFAARSTSRSLAL